ncbi:MAG: cysteine desulfurase [Gemmataceae bacterium]|nr:cysteine desulfurase [Gemmataceae bacterium]MDW8265482.1 cysteine desulfurase family protein [Gemmataceae bacterium]
MIYLDHNSTTPVLPEVEEAMRPFAAEIFGNPASAHAMGRKARQALESAREQVADLLQAHADEVVFTSGATEANNLAIFGLAGPAPGRILAAPIEHPSVVEPIRQLEVRGWSVSWGAVDGDGVFVPHQLEPTADLRLACLQLANHETGAIQPVRALAERLAGRVPLHCDAAQAAGKMPVRFHDLGVATLAISAHKFYGPKGIGALVVRRGVRLAPQLFGGHQQRGRRPGTEPVGLAVGLAKALALASAHLDARQQRLTLLRQRFLRVLRIQAAPVVLNGPETGGLLHTLNLSFPGCRADVLLMNLDLAGIACSTGSACSSGSLLPSPVLQAMGVGPDRLHSAMRFSLGFQQTEAEIEEAARRIAAVVRRLRQVPVQDEP